MKAMMKATLKSMRKALSLILALTLLMLTAAALGEDTSLSDLKSRGKLVLGFDASFPPMGFQDESGNYVGYDLDLAAEVARRMEVELVLQPIDWAAKELELNSGNIDCIWNGMTATADRAEAMALSLNYLNNAQIVCVLADSGISTLADLTGKKVAVQSGSAGAEALAANEALVASLGEKPLEYADYAMALMDLDNKGVDAVVVDIIVANYYIATKNAAYKVLDESLSPEYYAIGFRKGDVALRDEVNRVLTEMAGDGTISAIDQKWFGTDISIVGKE